MHFAGRRSVSRCFPQFAKYMCASKQRSTSFARAAPRSPHWYSFQDRVGVTSARVEVARGSAASFDMSGRTSATSS